MMTISMKYSYVGSSNKHLDWDRQASMRSQLEAHAVAESNRRLFSLKLDMKPGQLPGRPAIGCLLM